MRDSIAFELNGRRVNLSVDEDRVDRTDARAGLRWQAAALRWLQQSVSNALRTDSQRTHVAGSALALVSALSIGISTTVRAAETNTAPGEGERIAQMVCSACHIVASKQEHAPILRHKTPDFCEIANRPESTVRRLARFVTHTHWDEKSVPLAMPNPMLTPDQATAVGGYILSLRGQCTFGNWKQSAQ